MRLYKQKPARSKIINEATELYMPQVTEEIEQFSDFVYERFWDQQSVVTLEIGTKYGGSFYIWNSLFSLPDDHHISIDINDGGIHGGVPEERMDERDEFFRERFNHCYFIRESSHKPSTRRLVLEYLQRYHLPSIDFLFLDGDHSYEGIKEDYDMYIPLVRSGGIIALHDINDSERHRAREIYVAKFWNEIKNKYNTLEFNENKDWAGIGVVIKD